MEIVANYLIFFKKKSNFPFPFLTACTLEKSKPTNQAVFFLTCTIIKSLVWKNYSCDI